MYGKVSHCRHKVWHYVRNVVRRAVPGLSCIPRLVKGKLLVASICPIWCIQVCIHGLLDSTR